MDFARTSSRDQVLCFTNHDGCCWLSKVVGNTLVLRDFAHEGRLAQDLANDVFGLGLVLVVLIFFVAV